jgi:hypothetical protein
VSARAALLAHGSVSLGVLSVSRLWLRGHALAMHASQRHTAIVSRQPVESELQVIPNASLDERSSYFVEARDERCFQPFRIFNVQLLIVILSHVPSSIIVSGHLSTRR